MFILIHFCIKYNFRNNSINMAIPSSIWFQFWKYLNKTVQSSTEILTAKEFQIINTAICLALHLDMIFKDENYQFLHNINANKFLNKMMDHVLNHNDLFTIETFVSTSGCLVSIQEFSSFSTNDAKTLIAIISLPWMSISNNIFRNLPLYKQLSAIVSKYSILLSK